MGYGIGSWSRKERKAISKHLRRRNDEQAFREYEDEDDGMMSRLKGGLQRLFGKVPNDGKLYKVESPKPWPPPPDDDGMVISVLIPEEAQDLFRWMLKYDQRFAGSPTAVAAYLIGVGAKHEYEAGLQNATPLPDELQEYFTQSSLKALEDYVNSWEDDDPEPPKKAA